MHLWCLFPEDIADPALVKLYKGLLSDDELEKVKEAGSGPTHTGRVLARTLVRTTLARCKKPIFLEFFFCIWLPREQPVQSSRVPHV